jgi:hypothetical protein
MHPPKGTHQNRACGDHGSCLASNFYDHHKNYGTDQSTIQAHLQFVHKRIEASLYLAPYQDT